MPLLTKKAVDVFAPTNGGGAARPVNNAETQTWGSEIEALVGASDDASPLAIAVSGQSNMMLRLATTVTIPPNLQVWDFYGSTDASTKVGAGFLVPDGTWISVGLSYAIERAIENPHRNVRLIDISKGGMEIDNWGPSPPTYNFRQAFDGNVPVAMASLGISTIDAFVWWQGESDASLNNANYVAEFNSWVYDWLVTKSWFRPETPIAMCGFTHHAELPLGTPSVVYENYEARICGAVAQQPGTRVFVPVGRLPQDHWDPTGGIAYIHINATGAAAAGKLIHSSLHGGIAPAALQNVVVNPVTGNIAVGYDNAGNPLLPSPTQEFTINFDQAATTNVIIQNENTSASAVAKLQLISESGTASMQIASVAGNQQLQQSWTGVGSMAFTVSHASAGFAFNTNGTPFALYISSNGDIRIGGVSIADTRISAAGHLRLKSYTIATLPTAANAGDMIYVTNETGGAVVCFADGTNWRRVTDRAIAA